MDNTNAARKQLIDILTIKPEVRDTVALEIREWTKDENCLRSNREDDIYTFGALTMLNLLRRRAGLPPYEHLDNTVIGPNNPLTCK